MKLKSINLSIFLKWSSHMAGRPITFVIGLVLVFLWLLVGFFIGFSDTWLLIVNTIATINAALMVFIIQNTQNRESKALHLKIDELLISIQEAETELAAIEGWDEEELEKIKKLLHKKKKLQLVEDQKRKERNQEKMKD